MKHYAHLTENQRYQISSLLKAKTSQSEIARIIGCHKSTISREIRLNKGKRGYRPKQAQQLAQSRKANNSLRITDFGWAYIDTLIKRKLSPEQIMGRLRLLGWKGVPSHERIYQHIYKIRKQVAHYINTYAVKKAIGNEAHQVRIGAVKSVTVLIF